MSDAEDDPLSGDRDAQHGALRAAMLAVQAQLEGAAQGQPRPASVGVLRRNRALAHLIDACGLSPFEAQILVLGAAQELLPGIGALCATITGHEARPWPTFGVALGALSGAHWDALLPTAPLRSLRLVDLADGPVLTERALHVSERVLHAMLGWTDLDPRLARRVAPIEVTGRLPSSLEALVPRLVSAWTAEHTVRSHIQADRPGEASALVAHAASRAGAVAYTLLASDVPTAPADREELIALWSRESRLTPVVLVVDLDDRTDPACLRAAQDLLQRMSAPAVGISRDPLTGTRGAWSRLRVAPLGWGERRRLWRSVLGSDAVSDEDLDDLAARFALGPSQIASVCAEIRMRPEEPPAKVLWDASRAIARPRLEDLAQRIAPGTGGWSRLVLPDSQQAILRSLLAQVRHKATVQHRWGLSELGPRGTGTSAVFSGPSGTGKTLAAEVVATALDLDLYRIDLSAVVSKYIGETEKNLRRVFDAAEAGGAVLLFDEADALFGKRTDVKDSHDRHANIEVSYLLQRMESYGGLAILTTNFRKAIDDAFLRRIQFVVEFPFPEAPLRQQIWQRMFPPGVPTHGLDAARLGQLSLAGGNIHSIARNAAYLAADAQSPVTMDHVLAAARMEVDKLGRGLTPAELRGWTAP